MRRKVLKIGAMAAVVLFAWTAGDVFAYPWFARRLIDNCNKCHVAFPKTNDYGWYVKATGYELPEVDYTGFVEPKFKRLLRKFPAALRMKLDALNSEPKNLKGDITFREVQLMSGGSLLNNKVSWWYHKHVVEDNTFVSPFEGNPHEMWAQYNSRFGDYQKYGVSLRYGMSELPLRFSPSKTKVSEIPFAIYNAGFADGGFSLSTPQYGVALKAMKLGGEGFNKLNSTLSLALINGKGDFSSHTFNQVFGRVSTQVDGAMVGAFTYIGSKEVMPAMDEHGDEGGVHHDEADMDMMNGGEHVMMDNNFLRLGMDFDLNITTKLNLYGLALFGKDDNPLALDVASSGNFYGGFAGLDYCPSSRLMLQWRYDMVRFSDVPELAHNDEHADHEQHNNESTSALYKSIFPNRLSTLSSTEEGGHGHHGGPMITSKTDAMVFGLHYMLPVPNYQLRLTTEYRLGINGQGDLLLSGLQLAF